MTFANGQKGEPMSVETGKVCCNCRHCIRQWDNDDHYCGYDRRRTEKK